MLTYSMFATAFLAVGTFAIPTFNPTEPPSLVRRAGPGVYVCPAGDWQSPADNRCNWVDASDGKCHTQWMGYDGSFGPDKGLLCTLYEYGECDEVHNSAQGFVYPGYANSYKSAMLKSVGIVNPMSFKCETEL